MFVYTDLGIAIGAKPNVVTGVLEPGFEVQQVNAHGQPQKGMSSGSLSKSGSR
jgi:hypothetical protein